jgi:pyruvate dehydrogenase (quinone)
MSKSNVSIFTLQRLHAWGVRRIYGYPGDGTNGLNLAFHEMGDEVEFVQVRHEELASFAACAHAKLTGEVGVCMATSGPGAIHLLNGLYDAKLDNAPVVAIVGQQKRMSLGGDFQQEVDLRALYKDVASEYLGECNDPRQAAHIIDRAVRIARAERTVTAIIVPSDIQEMPYEEPPRAHGALFAGEPGFHDPLIRPGDEDLRRAAEVLNSGSKVAMLIGQGAKHATDEVIEVAEVLGAGVAKALNGRAAVPDDLPFVTGSIGLLGTKPSADMMEDCDTLLMVGTSFPYSEWLPEPGQARGVQIDLKASKLGIRYPVEVAMVGDAAETLRALLPQLERKEDRSWREEIEENVGRWWRLLDERSHVDAEPINPQLVFHELSGRLPDRSIVLADSGSATNWWARHLRLRRGMDAALSGTLATMCPAVPYALAAKLAYPQRPVIACLGDGAMQMIGINGLIDLAKYQDRWSGPLVVVVLNNGDLNQVTWEQRVLAGDAKMETTQDLPPFDFAAYARQLGLEGIRVESPGEVGPAWERALSITDRPVLIDVVTDPEVPPLPPHIRMEHAQGFARALFHGDADSGRIVRQSLREKVKDLVTR